MQFASNHDSVELWCGDKGVVAGGLSEYLREKRIFSLEEGTQKTTGETAKRTGLSVRRIIREDA